MDIRRIVDRFFGLGVNGVKSGWVGYQIRELHSTPFKGVESIPDTHFRKIISNWFEEQSYFSTVGIHNSEHAVDYIFFETSRQEEYFKNLLVPIKLHSYLKSIILLDNDLDGIIIYWADSNDIMIKVMR